MQGESMNIQNAEIALFNIKINLNKLKKSNKIQEFILFIDNYLEDLNKTLDFSQTDFKNLQDKISNWSTYLANELNLDAKNQDLTISINTIKNY